MYNRLLIHKILETELDLRMSHIESWVHELLYKRMHWLYFNSSISIHQNEFGYSRFKLVVNYRIDCFVENSKYFDLCCSRHWSSLVIAHYNQTFNIDIFVFPFWFVINVDKRGFHLHISAAYTSCKGMSVSIRRFFVVGS